MPARITIRIAAAALIFGALVVAVILGRVPGWLILVYLGAGALSAYFYSRDKDAARDGEWRISESTLHGIDLACGIIGGLLAQAALRHKTSKRDFGTTTAAIAGVHLLVLAALVIGVIAFP